jgi:copper chaperone CopZ
MTTNTAQHLYSVSAISCGHCKAAIEGEVAEVDGVDSVHVDIDAKTVAVDGGDDAAIRAAISEAGYDID